METKAEKNPVIVNVYRAQKSIPPACVIWRAGTTKRVIIPARKAGNRFLGSLKGLQTRALNTLFFILIQKCAWNEAGKLARTLMNWST
jgi:hypothetical protein